MGDGLKGIIVVIMSYMLLMMRQRLIIMDILRLRRLMTLSICRLSLRFWSVRIIFNDLLLVDKLALDRLRAGPRITSRCR